MLAKIHKDQSLEKLHRGPPPGVRAGKCPLLAPGAAPGAARKLRAPRPLKVFVAFMAIGLIVAATLGIYIAFKNIRARKLTWTLLVLGTALPVALLFL